MTPALLQNLEKVSRSEYLDYINSHETSHSDFMMFEGFRTSAAMYFKGERCVARMVETKSIRKVIVDYYTEAEAG